MPHVELESAIERDQRIGLVCADPRYDLLAAICAPNHPNSTYPKQPHLPAAICMARC